MLFKDFALLNKEKEEISEIPIMIKNKMKTKTFQ